MQVHVRVSADLAAVLGRPRFILTLDEEATPATALRRLRADYPAIAELLDRAVVVSGGRHLALDEPLQPGQELALLLPIAGGGLLPARHLSS